MCPQEVTVGGWTVTANWLKLSENNDVKPK
jgi:hypothetical protein